MEEKETKGTGRKITTVVIVLLLAGLLGGAYVHGINYFKTHFFTNTGIDGVDVGELTAAEAEQKLAEAFDVNNITIEGRDRSEELDVSEAGITRRYSGLEEAVASQDAVKWVFKRMEAAELELPYSFEYDEQKLLELADGIDQLREENQKAPENAYVGYDEASDSFIVVPEDRGSTIDTDKFHEVIKAAAEAGNSSIVLDNENVYYEPEIGSDDPELNSRAEYVNKLNCGTIRLDLGADTELTLRGDSILGLLDIGMFVENCTNGTPSDDSFVNEEALNGLVAKLSEKYNTYDPDKSKLFTTYSGENILIENEYGWKLNEEKTAAALRKRLQEICNAVILGDQDEFAVSEDNKDPNYIKASWSHSAASHEGYDYGEYYAEVDLGNQVVYLMDHGKCIWSSSCVSGMMTKERYTPGGIYAVTYKQLHRVLTGYNPDGSVQYRSPVTYWMPFNKGIGFHDATWRGTFGGSIYVYGGSHGCINLPFSKAKLLYDLVYTGMPVILYY